MNTVVAMTQLTRHCEERGTSDAAIWLGPDGFNLGPMNSEWNMARFFEAKPRRMHSHAEAVARHAIGNDGKIN